MYVLFGVKTDDIEEANKWLEELLCERSQGRHNEYVGEYYKFGGFSGETVKLCSGTTEDEEGDYPTDEDHPDWALLVFLDDTAEDSARLKALEARPDRFEKLRANRYEDDERDGS
ncbi:MAG: hypothetical protein KJ622_13815 [Alphaproteobacteria bacterium]|nr:hypothetical protein [Alphaproteobacteria bacterium]